ncbi:hypothetical protein G6M89_08595 [Natronolimnobius sp. AArcel1]|uniref:hypothetical protein n=1 Tax=Natronolimnobius sp. AArcel1 TaxID=1679093 RepID=UPI0013EA2608|nr:hypothetical protein [Natronolimnobius sp. AArcel1]NGM69067.1 hypothetical protein [Natronolimnobius sp. AArcel1]
MPSETFTDLFEETRGEKWKLAEDAPEIYWEAIESLEESLEDGNNRDIILSAFTEETRPLEYTGRISVINTTRATLFFDVDDEVFKPLSIGMTQGGPLNGDQVSSALNELYEKAEVTTAELLQSKSKSEALRSIKQSRDFIIGNVNSFLQECMELKQFLHTPKKNRDEIYEKQAPRVERELHNLLSSVWTFQETVDASLKKLEVSDEHKHYLQKYEDEISTATGLRHCIQHTLSIRINWIAQYSHSMDRYEFSIGVPLAQVHNDDLYDGVTYYDAGGDPHSPLEYFYGDINDRIINLEELADSIQKHSANLYESLKEELYGDSRVDPEKAKKHHVITCTEFFDVDDDIDTVYL